MHPPQVRAEILAMVASGLNACEIARRTGIPRGTVRDWRHAATGRGRPSTRSFPLETCPRCWRAAKPIRFTAADYAELLGLYLGDGCISEGARSDRLRVTLDTKYPNLIAELHALLGRCFPENRIGETPKRGEACVAVWVYSTHLACLFPQHGRGKKHERAIELEEWQWQLVRDAPGSLLRGLIRSDGCVFINRTGPDEYLTYGFSNYSRDIIDIFRVGCEMLGVEYRVNGTRGWHVRINRRPSVAVMLEHVGLKT
jgi:hypothetical protein